MRKLLENGVHFGHQTRRWDPKCKEFIYTAKNGIYIIDLNKTQESLQVAYDKMKKIAEDGGKVLFVGTLLLAGMISAAWAGGMDGMGGTKKQMNAGVRSLVFVVGGAFGFAPSVYKVAHDKISLSQMTFNHQMVRLFFVEQLYRGFSILHHEPYHNE